MNNSILHEQAWKSVDLTDRRGVTGQQEHNADFSSYKISTSWYNKILANAGTRLSQMRNYDNADNDCVEIGRALDVITEDITAMNADDTESFDMDFGDTEYTKSVIDVVNTIQKLWEKRTGFREHFFDRVRKTIKYGATFYMKNPDGTLTELPTERMAGYILSETDENVVTHYLYDPTIPRLDGGGRQNKSQTGVSQSRENYVTIPVDALLVLKVGDTPFGESILKKAYRVYKIMKMLEDAIVVYRVTRSYERRVYYIDVGNLQGSKREAAIRKQQARINQKKYNNGKELVLDYNPNSMGEDIFIPTNSTGKGSRVEQLSGGASLGEITDLEWFGRKLASALRIPSSMIDVGEQADQTQHTDMRVGQMYQIEMRYLGHIKRLKQPFVRELDKNLREFALARDVLIPEDVSLKVNNSMSFAEYKKVELDQVLLNVANSTAQMSHFGKKFVLQHFVQLSAEEIDQNEESILRQYGLSDEQIKKMPREHRENIVYGDKSKGGEYGLTVDDDTAQGW